MQLTDFVIADIENAIEGLAPGDAFYDLYKPRQVDLEILRGYYREILRDFLSMRMDLEAQRAHLMQSGL